MPQEHNIAFIDSQNLYLGCEYKIDYPKLRVYLAEKYQVQEAIFFIGVQQDSHKKLYDNLSQSGFTVKFREHNKEMNSKKKGNVDTDIVFSIMENLIENKQLNKVLLISGDGDYFKLVNYLVEKNRLKKMLFPNFRYASSLYKQLGSEYYDTFSNENIRRLVALRRRV